MERMEETDRGLIEDPIEQANINVLDEDVEEAMENPKGAERCLLMSI